MTLYREGLKPTPKTPQTPIRARSGGPTSPLVEARRRLLLYRLHAILVRLGLARIRTIRALDQRAVAPQRPAEVPNRSVEADDLKGVGMGYVVRHGAQMPAPSLGDKSGLRRNGSHCVQRRPAWREAAE